MLIISKEQVNGLTRRLQEGSELESCMQEVSRMIDIKTALAWRADAGVGGG